MQFQTLFPHAQLNTKPCMYDNKLASPQPQTLMQSGTLTPHAQPKIKPRICGTSLAALEPQTLMQSLTLTPHAQLMPSCASMAPP